MKVALTDVFPSVLYPLVAEAAPDGWEYEVAADGSEETRSRMISEADFLFCGGAVTTDRMLEEAPRLRYVQKLGAGFNNINVELCKQRGIGIGRLAGNNAPAVAEHTVLLMLAVYKRLIYADRYVREGNWSKEMARGTNRELRGKTVGLLGFGYIGRAVAQRLQGFEVEIVYYDPVRADARTERECGATYVELDELMRRSNVVSLHLPIGPETQNIVNRERIRMMPPGGIIVNCARGGLIEEEALEEALRDGHLFGAGLDTYAREEAGGSSAFWDLDNVVLTGHIAGSSVENFRTMMARAFENAQRYLANEPIPDHDVIWLPEVKK